MGHIKIKTPVNYTTNEGQQSIIDSVLCINTMNWNRGQSLFTVTDLIYLSEQFSIGNSTQLFQLPTQVETGEFETVNIDNGDGTFTDQQVPVMKDLPMLNSITIDRNLVLKYLNPLLCKILTEEGYACEDLILINTAWATIDGKGLPIDLEARKTRIFLTWEQSTNFTENYTDIVAYINAIGIPKVTDLHGKWLYFEYLDDPQSGETPMENLLCYVIGAYIEKR